MHFSRDVFDEYPRLDPYRSPSWWSAEEIAAYQNYWAPRSPTRSPSFGIRRRIRLRWVPYDMLKAIARRLRRALVDNL